MKNHQVIAISGATSGMGHAVLNTASQNNAAVVFSGRRNERIRQIEEEHGKLGHSVFGLCADVITADHYARLNVLAEKKTGQVPTAFVLCAGRGLPGTLTTSDPEQWQELININVLAAMHQLRSCAAFFSDQANISPRVRDIVVIGSTVGRSLSAANPVYGATKFALHSLVESLRQELCAKQIRVTLIEPGFVRSEFQTVAGYDMDWFDNIEQEQGPFLNAQDIADVIQYALELPPHVHVDDFRIRPTKQRV
ncbi:SDR family oxidoreductase [Photobacterium leiognathi]|uniref:SDR family oxidoreductase n=1 Tax=Photobacterium leiognathi TaxID=553611 RepID=UPI002739EBC4|nr:SDR family oxidoreductase [Photobacterium leiognathi]